MNGLTKRIYKWILTLWVFLCQLTPGFCQDIKVIQPSYVDIDAYQDLIKEVKSHRRTRLVNLDQFMRMSKETRVIILDTRSDSMYVALHVKGAVHLNFSDFTQDNLKRVIPSGDYKILIYCNNNFESSVRLPVDVSRYMVTKASNPAQFQNPPAGMRKITLALNIPTYINLYGYGYRNIYELSELVDPNNSHLEFEGTSLRPQKINTQKN